MSRELVEVKRGRSGELGEGNFPQTRLDTGSPRKFDELGEREHFERQFALTLQPTSVSVH